MDLKCKLHKWAECNTCPAWAQRWKPSGVRFCLQRYQSKPPSEENTWYPKGFCFVFGNHHALKCYYVKRCHVSDYTAASEVGPMSFNDLLLLQVPWTPSFTPLLPLTQSTSLWSIFLCCTNNHQAVTLAHGGGPASSGRKIRHSLASEFPMGHCHAIPRNVHGCFPRTLSLLNHELWKMF